MFPRFCGGYIITPASQKKHLAIPEFLPFLSWSYSIAVKTSFFFYLKKEMYFALHVSRIWRKTGIQYIMVIGLNNTYACLFKIIWWMRKKRSKEYSFGKHFWWRLHYKLGYLNLENQSFKTNRPFQIKSFWPFFMI